MNIPTVIFFVICAFCLGIALGGFLAGLRQEKKPRGQVIDSQPGDLIHLGKDPESGSLQVILAGQVFHTVAEMSNVQRALAGYAANDLRAWLSPQTTAAQPAESKTSGDGEGSDVDAAPAPASVPTSPPAVTLSGPELGVGMAPEAEEDLKKRKRGGFIGMITRALSAETSSLRFATKSIAVQVNEILQEKLKDTPLESRGICLIEMPGQEMVVMIGLDKYDSVSAVPDDEVRGVLQSAVNEWLARSTK
jgi:hypothetical protein